MLNLVPVAMPIFMRVASRITTVCIIHYLEYQFDLYAKQTTTCLAVPRFWRGGSLAFDWSTKCMSISTIIIMNTIKSCTCTARLDYMYRLTRQYIQCTTDKQTYMYMYRHTCTCIYMSIIVFRAGVDYFINWIWFGNDPVTCAQVDRQTKRQTDRQTNRQYVHLIKAL